MAATWSTHDDLFLQVHVDGIHESVMFCARHGTLIQAVRMQKLDITPLGKTWTGRIEPLEGEFLTRLSMLLAELNWNGGGEIECIVDRSRRRWLFDWNPRFPAWVFGATLCGYNLPACLLRSEIDDSEPFETDATDAPREFTRVVVEIPRGRNNSPQPTTLDSLHDVGGENIGNAKDGAEHLANFHPSGTPILYRKLRQQSMVREARHRGDTSTETDHDLVALRCCECDTPERVFFESKAKSRFATALKIRDCFAALGISANVAYSVKTNPDKRLLDLAIGNGLYAEVISQPEAESALRQGFLLEDLVLNGPGKWWPNRLIVGPVRAVFCDSLEELELTVSEARCGSLLAACVGVRLRPTNLHSRFGIPLVDLASVEGLARILSRLPKSQGVGIHIHVASSRIGIPAWLGLFESVVTVCTRLESLMGRPVDVLDLGGGWTPEGWDEFMDGCLVEKMSPPLRQLPELSEVIFEVGKALAQPSMALVSRIIQIRRGDRGSVRCVVVDCSIADLPHIASFPHRALFQKANRDGLCAIGRGLATVYGRNCMESDVLLRNAAIPVEAREGDYVVFCDAGAYDASMAYRFGVGSLQQDKGG